MRHRARTRSKHACTRSCLMPTVEHGVKFSASCSRLSAASTERTQARAQKDHQGRQLTHRRTDIPQHCENVVTRCRHTVRTGCVWVCGCVCVSVSLSAGAGRDRAKSETGLSSPVPDQQRSSSSFPVCSVGFPIAHLSFVCLSHGGGRLRPSQVWQVQSKVGGVGLPTPSKSQKMSHTALPWCSPLSINSSHLRAISHCHNSISKQENRRNQLLLHWTSHRWDRDSTSLLGTIRPQRELRSCTSLLGMAVHHLQRQTLTLTPSSTLN